MGPSLINKTTQTPLAVAIVALAVVSSRVWENFAGTAEENSVGVACLDRVGPGRSHRGPSLDLGCGSSKHRADSRAVARKRPLRSSAQEWSLRLSRGSGAGVASSSRSSSRPPHPPDGLCL